jgi:hypothetical protein
VSSQTEPKAKKPVWQETPFLVGLGLTVLVFLLVGYSLFYLSTNTPIGEFESKWAYLIQASPNEIGDTLAGFAGSLAFVWLVVTVWLQATELREQRDEFERMADAQQKQVELLVTQGMIFEKEQRERQQESERKLVDEFLAGFCDIVRLLADGNNRFLVAGKNGGTNYHNFFEGHSALNDADLLKKLAFFPPDIVGGITKLQKAGSTFISGPSRDDFIDLGDRVYQAVVRLDDLSNDQRQRIINCGVEEIHSWITEIVEHEFWHSFANESEQK